MKLMNKLFAALVLFGMSNAAFGYDFGIQNKTTQPITVAVKVRSGSSNQAVIQPNKRNIFSFTGSEAALCLESISVNGKNVAIKELASVEPKAKEMGSVEPKLAGTSLCRSTDILILPSINNDELIAVYRKE